MAQTQKKSFMVKGRVAGLGITCYERGGRTYLRTSTRKAPSRQSVGQFKTRSKMRQSIALWGAFGIDHKPLMDTSDGLMAYTAFLKANAGLPTTYLTKNMYCRGGVLLQPETVVSSGRMPQVAYRFDLLADGRRVVLTSLATGIDPDELRQLDLRTNADVSNLLRLTSRNPQLQPGDMLRFYRLQQQVEDGCPGLRVECCDCFLDDGMRRNVNLESWRFLSVRGFLAIADADSDDQGWAVVHYSKKKQTASPQKVLTACQTFRQYTTDEAFVAAAKSYGNVARLDTLIPNDSNRE